MEWLLALLMSSPCHAAATGLNRSWQLQELSPTKAGYRQSSKGVSSLDSFRGSYFLVPWATHKVLKGPKHVLVVFAL